MLSKTVLAGLVGSMIATEEFHDRGNIPESKQAHQRKANKKSKVKRRAAKLARRNNR